MLAERIPTQVLTYDTNLKDQISHETTQDNFLYLLSSILIISGKRRDTWNQWKAREKWQSAGRVTKREKSDKTREER